MKEFTEKIAKNIYRKGGSNNYKRDDIMNKKRGNSISRIAIKLKHENKELKNAIKILSNVRLIKKLNNALDDIKEGRYSIRI